PAACRTRFTTGLRRTSPLRRSSSWSASSVSGRCTTPSTTRCGFRLKRISPATLDTFMPEAASVSYFVRYEGQAENQAAFLAHYRDHHAPILARFPGIVRIVLHTPISWQDPFPVKPDSFALLAQMVFATKDDLDRALR